MARTSLHGGGVFILSRSIGQSVVIDETVVLTVAAIDAFEASLIRTNEAGLEGGEIAIRSGGYTEVAPGVAATYIPFEPRKLRMGFIATAGHVVRPASSALSASTFGRQEPAASNQGGMAHSTQPLPDA